MNGYLSPLYAESLAEFGTPLHLPQSDGWLLARPIPDAVEQDAVGCYPLFNCGNWAALGSDLDELAADVLAVSLVVDPFAAVDTTTLCDWFPDVCRPFKEHAVVDFDSNWRLGICRHHRRNVRAAARCVEVEACTNPSRWLDTWSELYGHLIVRHGVRGIARFSRSSFARQLNVPGIAAWRAAVADETVGMLLWYLADQVAYYHLGAFNLLGYESRAAFALFDVALADLAARGVRWATLGAGAGWQSASSDGLARFKNGWTNDRRVAWFCGRILAPAKYEQVTAARKVGTTAYFPEYRLPEAA
jgi:GNAT acetyltransferase-like protein